MTLLREKAELQSQLEENEEDMSELMKKYKAAVQQVNTQLEWGLCLSQLWTQKVQSIVCVCVCV